jgi:hypothetical protein
MVLSGMGLFSTSYVCRVFMMLLRLVQYAFAFLCVLEPKIVGFYRGN